MLRVAGRGVRAGWGGGVGSMYGRLRSPGSDGRLKMGKQSPRTMRELPRARG